MIGKIVRSSEWLEMAFLQDYDERNTFDVQEYLQHRLKLKESEVCDVYEEDVTEDKE